MIKNILYGALMMAAVYFSHWCWRRELDRNAERYIGTGWRLFVTVLPMAVGGLVFTVWALRGLIRGEMPCVSKGGGCTVAVHLRHTDPTNYWATMVYVAVLAIVLLWGVYLVVDRWRAHRDSY